MSFNPLTTAVLRNTLLEQMVDGAEWRRLKAAREAAQQHTRAIRLRHRPQPTDALDAARTAFLDGTPLPDDLGEHLLAHKQAATVDQAELDAVTALLGEFDGALDAEVARVDLWAALQQQLDAALDQASALGDRPADAEAAIATGKVEAWQQFQTAQEAYLCVRDAHRSLLAAEDTSLLAGASIAWHILFQGVDDVWPQWLEHSLTGGGAIEGFRSINDAPWSKDARSIQHFNFIVSNRAELRPWTARAQQIRQQFKLDSGAARVRDAEARDLPGRRPMSDAEVNRQMRIAAANA